MREIEISQYFFEVTSCKRAINPITKTKLQYVFTQELLRELSVLFGLEMTSDDPDLHLTVYPFPICYLLA
jgi:hypothetical protein